MRDAEHHQRVVRWERDTAADLFDPEYCIIRCKRATDPPPSNGKIEHFWLVLQQDWDLWHAMRSDKAAAITELKPLRPPP